MSTIRYVQVTIEPTRFSEDDNRIKQLLIMVKTDTHQHVARQTMGAGDFDSVFDYAVDVAKRYIKEAVLNHDKQKCTP